MIKILLAIGLIICIVFLIGFAAFVIVFMSVRSDLDDEAMEEYLEQNRDK